MAAQGPPSSLHDLAVDAQSDVTKLATGLAHAGADPQAVHQLTAMADLLAQVVKVLAEGPSLDQGQPPQGAAPQGPPPPGAAPQGPPPGPPPAAPGPAQPSAPPPAHEQMAKHSLQSATHALHASMIASKSAREGQ